MLVVSLAVIVPVWWATAVTSLPSLESELDLERFLRGRIEGERIANFPGGRPDKAAVAFHTPELPRYPKDMVGLYISGHGCPTFFQSPKEESGAWFRRLVAHQLLR